MSVSRKKAEIFRLISKLSIDPIPVSRPTEPGPGALSHGADGPLGPTRDKSGRRRTRRLSELKERRKRLETTFIETRVMALYRRLEERIDALDRFVHEPGRLVAALPESQRPASSAPSISPAAAPQLTSPEPVTEHTLAGAIQEGILADMLQLIAANMMSGIFTVEDGQSKVEVVFGEGEIRHATSASAVGEGAFFAAMAMEQGRFYFHETNDIPEERSIQGKAQLLILEALRQIDESRQGEE